MVQREKYRCWGREIHPVLLLFKQLPCYTLGNSRIRASWENSTSQVAGEEEKVPPSYVCTWSAIWTTNLEKQAKSQGVSRFLLYLSIRVRGSSTQETARHGHKIAPSSENPELRLPFVLSSCWAGLKGIGNERVLGPTRSLRCDKGMAGSSWIQSHTHAGRRAQLEAVRRHT